MFVNPGAPFRASATIVLMILTASFLMASALLDAVPPPTHFDVTASYAPRRAGAGEVAVRFVARDPDVKINESPAPKLKLEEGPVVVVPPAPARPAAQRGEGDKPAAYLDLTLPVAFPVTVAPGTAKGAHDARGTVTYFYCSKREHWCRRGVTEIAFSVTVP